MKQILQHLQTGAMELAEVPSRSLISIVTERILVEFGKAYWIAKAPQQPRRHRWFGGEPANCAEQAQPVTKNSMRG